MNAVCTKYPATIVLDLTEHPSLKERRMRSNKLPTVAGYSLVKLNEHYLYRECVLFSYNECVCMNE